LNVAERPPEAVGVKDPLNVLEAPESRLEPPDGAPDTLNSLALVPAFVMERNVPSFESLFLIVNV
jgi:hypothetical protein